jgi:hypothetical protein
MVLDYRGSRSGVVGTARTHPGCKRGTSGPDHGCPARGPVWSSRCPSLIPAAIDVLAGYCTSLREVVPLACSLLKGMQRQSLPLKVPPPETSTDELLPFTRFAYFDSAVLIAPIEGKRWRCCCRRIAQCCVCNRLQSRSDGRHFRQW